MDFVPPVMPGPKSTYTPVRKTDATSEQLNLLLDGYDIWRMKPHEALHFSVFS
jgi:hypothetical protein